MCPTIYFTLQPQQSQLQLLLQQILATTGETAHPFITCETNKKQNKTKNTGVPAKLPKAGRQKKLAKFGV